MKRMMRQIILIAVAMISLHALADNDTDTTKHDTIYFYKTWQQMLDLRPEAMLIDPVIMFTDDLQLFFKELDNETDKIIKNQYLAISVGVSTWFLNSNYFRHSFSGECDRMKGFIPLYFNDKVAYVTYMNRLEVLDVLIGNNSDGVTTHTLGYYHIDFKNYRVEKVTHEYLSVLLEDYRDLLMRYEGMKDYKKPEIIEDYYFKYIDRYTDDLMTPYIVDLVSDNWYED